MTAPQLPPILLYRLLQLPLAGFISKACNQSLAVRPPLGSWRIRPPALEWRLMERMAPMATRLAAVSEAIREWLRHRQVAQLQQAYADLSQLQGGDLEEATVDEGGMGAEALERCGMALDLTPQEP